MGSASHVLVVFESSRAGGRALELAAAVADEYAARITVAIVIAYERAIGCCLRSVQWNRILDEIALEEVGAAREILGERDPPPRFEIVPSDDGRGLPSVVERLGCDLVLVPKRRWGGGRAIRRLRGATPADVRSVTSAQRPPRQPSPRCGRSWSATGSRRRGRSRGRGS
ncbi:MAG: hypothetical protein EDQ89_07810 [Acidobacteria bacterium]|nr:MAG: hypothetical protein EDQ89_07810 [Acidobacteriota bacterium]MCL4286094.1 universal stress protein [Thermoleophilia bacterium]GIK78409.1 MAG: hypothetical protein BroJett022_20990 [Actinomycetes bacterium]